MIDQRTFMIVSDGKIYGLLTDFIVDPEHRRKAVEQCQKGSRNQQPKDGMASAIHGLVLR